MYEVSGADSHTDRDTQVLLKKITHVCHKKYIREDYLSEKNAGDFVNI